MFQDNSYTTYFTLLLLVFPLLGTETTSAHNPHDAIEAAAISPEYARDQTVFIAPINEGLFKSTNGGVSWKLLVNGLDNTGPISSIAISPAFQLDQTLFVSTVGDGIFRSGDGGKSWVQTSNGLDNLSIDSLSMSTSYDTDKVVLAIDNQGVLYKTKNAGTKWYHVSNFDAPITTVAFNANQKNNVVLIGDSNGSLYKSHDSGNSWKQSFLFKDSGAVTSIAISPNNSSDTTIYVGTEERGIFKSTDAKSFLAVSTGLSDTSIRSLSLSPNYETDSTIFASTWNKAVFKSTNGGANWQLYTQGITTNKQADSVRHKSPHFRKLCISNDFVNDKTLFLAGFDGLFKSTNGGHEWKEMETLTTNRISGMDISPDGNSIAITTTGKGVYISNNRGLKWTKSNKGLNTVELMNVAFSPNYPSDNTIFVVSEIDFAISTDGGNNWKPTKLEEDHKWTNLIRRVLRRVGFSQIKIIKGRRLSSDIIAPSPNFSSDKIIYLGTRYDGIFQSLDMGFNWNAIWPDQRISDLVISHEFSSDNTLFAFARVGGIFKSVDRGLSFQPINTGMMFKYSHIWQSSPQKGDLNLMLSPDYINDQNVFAGTPEGLFRSKNGGENWQRLQIINLSERDYIMDMAISPDYENDQTIITSVRGRGLFKSNDSGLTFFEIGSNLINNNYSLERIAFSPTYATDRTIYGTSYQEIFKSINNGRHWKILPKLYLNDD